MKYWTRFMRLNGEGGLMFQRKLFGWLPFRDYEPFNNHKYKLEAEMNELFDKFAAVHEKYRELQKTEGQINKLIERSHEAEVGTTVPEIKNLSFFPRRKARLARPDGRWVSFAKTLMGSTGTMADVAKSDRGGNGVVETMPTCEGDYIPVTSMPIRPQNNNNQKNKGNQNNNQRNN